jgi:hypothetical protein
VTAAAALADDPLTWIGEECEWCKLPFTEEDEGQGCLGQTRIWWVHWRCRREIAEAKANRAKAREIRARRRAGELVPV